MDEIQQPDPVEQLAAARAVAAAEQQRVAAAAELMRLQGGSGEPGAALQPARRRPGRPGWTAALFWTRYREARARATPPYTDRSIAPHFETLDGTRGTDLEYVRKLVRRHGLPPE